MTDNNLTDNEIIKTCENCLHYNICSLWSTTDLTAEEHHKYCYGNFTDKNLLKQIKAEAYKEFAERLKANFEPFNSPLLINRIDNLLKELVK